MNNLVNPSRWDTDILGDSILRNSHWLEEIVKQDLARVDRRKLSSCHKGVLVVVNDLYIMGVAILPTEANAPLVIDADAVLAAPSTFEFLQSIARKYSQIGQCLSGVQRDHAARCTCYEDCVSARARHEPRGYKRGRQRTRNQLSIAPLSLCSMNIITHPTACGKAPVRVQTSRSFLNQELR
jgi:hypothetical protein